MTTTYADIVRKTTEIRNDGRSVSHIYLTSESIDLIRESSKIIVAGDDTSTESDTAKIAGYDIKESDTESIVTTDNTVYYL